MVEELWWILAEDPNEDAGLLVLDAFPAGARFPKDRETLQRAITESAPGLLRSIEEKQEWAVQLGVRLSWIHGLSIRPELQLALGKLTTTDPALVLRQVDAAYDSRVCGGFFHGFVQYFGPLQEITDGASPRLENVEARIAALSGVEDSELIEVRDWCLGLLEVQAEGIRESPFPRMLKNLKLDLASIEPTRTFRGIIVVRATVGTDGRVKSVEILRGSDADVNEIIIDAMSRIAFEPKIENGEAVEFEYIVMVRPHHR